MQVGEIRPATVEDFKQLLNFVTNHDGWEEKPDRGGVKVWMKSDASTPVKMIKLSVDFDDVSALTLYDVLHDPKYRQEWDESMIEGLDVYKIDNYNDIGYYSVRCPPPLKNRDFVNQRSWAIFGGDHMIMNHTIDIEEMPVKKDFVRGVSYLTGYLVREKANHGCSVHYITQNDPGGQVPKWFLNRISSVVAPKVLDKIHKAALSYEQWKSCNQPNCRPWRGIGEDDKPYWPRLINNCRSSNSTPSLDIHKSYEVLSAIPNGVHDIEGYQYGSLDSLASVKVNKTAVKPEVTNNNIISNVIITNTPSNNVHTPLVIHESIKISTYPNNDIITQEQLTSTRSAHREMLDSELRRSNLFHSESIDTTSEITQLCHTLSKLTGGNTDTHMFRDEKKKPMERAPYITTPFASVSVLANSIDPDSCTRVSRNTLGNFGNSTLVTMVNNPKQRTHAARYVVDPIPENVVQQPRRKHRSSGADEGLESQTLKFLNKMKQKPKTQRHRHRTKTTSGDPVRGAEPRAVLSPRTLRRNQTGQIEQT